MNRTELIAICALIVGCMYSTRWTVGRTLSAVHAAEEHAMSASVDPVSPSVRRPSAAVSITRTEGEADACYEALERAGVAFERIPQRDAPGVGWPIRLSGAIAGVRVYGAPKNAPTNYLDCRLGRALLEWSPLLKRAGVVGLQHYSMYRHDATIGESTKASGHASGRAIDVAYFDLADGRRLSVLDDWKNRKRAVEPCSVTSGGDAEKRMRELVCDALGLQLFQVVVTPHHNEAHKNHVHLEVGPPDAEAWVR